MAPISVTIFTGFLGSRPKFVENTTLIHLYRRGWKNELDPQVPPQVSPGLQDCFTEERIWGCTRWDIHPPATPLGVELMRMPLRYSVDSQLAKQSNLSAVSEILNGCM